MSKPNGNQNHKLPSPSRYAAAVAIPYFVVAWAYILITTPLADAIAIDQQHLATIEKIKGSAFILFSAIFLYILSRVLFSRLLHKERELERSTKALVLSENRAVAGVFASSIAHDMNNIMMGLYNDVVDYAAQGDLSKEEQERANRLGFAAREMMELARKLSQSGKNTIPGTPERIDLAECLSGILAFARHHRSVRHCEIEEDIQQVPTIDGIQVILRQVFLNLILNAGEATEGMGKIRIVCYQESNNTIVEIHDNGPGINEEEIHRIFEPFVSTKGGGTGLGLHSVKAGVNLHGGKVACGASPLGGALFRVIFPTGSREAISAELAKLSL